MGVEVYGNERLNLTMQNLWITSAAGRKAIGYLTDPRPAWLWSADGKHLIWHNVAARLAGAKAKRHKIKRQTMMLPIKGQIARLIRLGALNRSSLSRMQFTRGTKPVSATCTCTPLALDNGKLALLIVGVDPVNAEVLDRVGMNSDDITAIFGADYSFTLFDVNGMAIAADADHETPATMPEGGVSLPAGADGETICIFKRPETPAEATETPIEYASEEDAGTLASNGNGVYKNLTQLLDRLSQDENLFAPLDPLEDEGFDADDDEAGFWVEAEEPPQHVEPVAPQGSASGLHDVTWADVVAEGQQIETETDNDDIAAFARANEDQPEPEDDVLDAVDDAPVAVDTPATDADHEDLADTPTPPRADATSAYWQIVGRGFQPKTSRQQTSPPPIAAEGTQQSTRYNFSELSRILNERIAGERAEARTPTGPMPGAASDEVPSGQRGALFSLSDESLVLNRLPLGLLIFRDQKILFANRAMTDLVGYDDSVTLRAQGLDAVFPRFEDGGENAGPVTQLSHRNGGRVPVSARLQAINWQGSPALMLTAKTQTSTPGVEAAVRSFAEQLAGLEGNGYFETSRAGIISSVSGQAADMFGRTPQVLIGRPLLLLVDHDESPSLRKFLEEAARRAETSRPAIALKGLHENLRVLLFAEGQAGYVTGYFGIVQNMGGNSEAGSPIVAAQSSLDPAILERLSRGMRRPLNTIIGFSELLRSSAFGPIENQRYVEYARDIKSAGQEIVQAVDEIEELSRIDSGDYDVRPIEFDLATLLHECIGKVRAPAGRARVFVRSSISEALPHIRADRASLAQAILNLLASAINQSQPGNHVVLSAQGEDDGSVAIHVRSSGNAGPDLAEHFVVFREDAPPLGQAVASSVGLALTRSLLAINTCTLSIESGLGHGCLLSLFIPGELAAPAEGRQ